MPRMLCDILQIILGTGLILIGYVVGRRDSMEHRHTNPNRDMLNHLNRHYLKSNSN